MITVNQRFEYKTMERVTEESGVRFYTCPDTGLALPSVTTILDYTADKSHLIEWRKWVGDKKAEEIRKEATGLGSLMHEHLECYVQNVQRPQGNNLVRKMAAAMSDKIIDRGLCHVSEVWGMEVALHYPGLYAGTCDLVGLYKGRPAIMDYKTAKKLRTREMIGDYMCQCAAYALAHNHLFGTDIDFAIVFMVDRENNFREFILEGRDFKSSETDFLNRVEIFHEASSYVSENMIVS